MDFFTLEVLTLVGLVRRHVLVVIDLASRRVEVAGIVREPYDAWMRQIARNPSLRLRVRACRGPRRGRGQR